MSEKIPTINNLEAKKVPNEREVMKIIEDYTEGKPYSEIIRHEDETGLYRLVVEIIGDDGDPVRYDYVRAGKFPKGNWSETAIDVIYLDERLIPVGGSRLALFVNGVWVRD